MEVFDRAREDPVQNIILQTAIKIEDIKNSNNSAGMAFLRNNMLDEHEDRLNLSKIDLRFNSRNLVWLMENNGIDPTDHRNRETLSILLNLYLYSYSKEYNLDFGYSDLLPTAKRLVDYPKYSFKDPLTRASGFYFNGSLWVSSFSDYMVKEYSDRLKMMEEQELNELELENENILQALEDFPEKYSETRGGVQDTDQYVQRVAHEYIHLLYDQLNIEKSDQTVNESLAWFADAYKAKGNKYEMGSPQSEYEQPMRIYYYSRLLYEKYTREIDYPAFSWIIEYQEKLEGVENIRDRFKILLLPGQISNYFQLMSKVSEFYRDFAELASDIEEGLAKYSPELRKEFIRIENDLNATRPEDYANEIKSEVYAEMDRRIANISNQSKDDISQSYDRITEIFRSEVVEERNKLENLISDINSLIEDIVQLVDLSPKSLEQQAMSRQEFSNIESIEDIAINLFILRSKIKKERDLLARI